MNSDSTVTGRPRRDSDETARGRLTWRVILVWDLPLRLFHWAMVALMPVLYATWRWGWMTWHVLAGDALLALLLFRLLWGVFGSDTARFARFLGSPRRALEHLTHLRRRGAEVQVGHNPAGGWMVAAMLVVLLAQTLTGLFVQNDVVDEGPLSELVPAPLVNAVTALHTILWDVLLAMVALHVLAILAYAALKKDNLVRPMITGRKRLPVETPAPRIAGLARALLLLAGGAAGASLIATLL